MIFDAATALIWILYLALFPMAFYWFRRAWRIFVNKDYSEVAVKKGLSPANPEKWATVTGVVNMLAGGAATWIIVGVALYIATGILIGPFNSFDGWNAYAGSTIWLKLIIDFIIKRQAHPIVFGKKNKETAQTCF
ncbi:hypothetical protein [Trichlorobacter ammonificans]|uniref:Uncharacterized protein n=1 Tax=Trichlorobacter ammonificans TaxID=2916410 RepID=A0ABM9D6N4_9BACT|nr:hypothetical protein [Trichlorobacter ammonificans]CAH2030895.1 conserved protein of unknown function [Trichlorobacter ammonificans]